MVVESEDIVINKNKWLYFTSLASFALPFFRHLLIQIVNISTVAYFTNKANSNYICGSCNQTEPRFDYQP